MPTWYSSRLRAKAGRWLRHNREEKRNGLSPVYSAGYRYAGFEPAKEFVERFVMSDIEKKQLFYDSKTVLQELVQSHKETDSDISYPVEEESGPDHDKHFVVRCSINGKLYGSGQGHTKKAAEQGAAYETILMLRQEK